MEIIYVLTDLDYGRTVGVFNSKERLEEVLRLLIEYHAENGEIILYEEEMEALKSKDPEVATNALYDIIERVDYEIEEMILNEFKE